ncbi:MAG: DUF4238 domain-containing protein [Chloroflexi bacterium]|nr:DUF4238 domain-containing protein [Chloroflexota bacterium]
MNEQPKHEIARDNHYVPQATLRRWSSDGKTLFAYRLLVSHPSVPEWEAKSIRGLASQRDLYTVFSDNVEQDDFERLTVEFEQPAISAIDKVVQGDRLKRDDWHSLARFVALQDLRTPSNFFESMRRWEKTMPELLESTTRQALKEFERSKAKGIPLSRDTESNEFSGLIKSRVEESPEPDSNDLVIRTEITIGRRLWIASMRHALSGVVETLCDHKWSIVESSGDMEWPLTDHPVLRLNYESPGKYDFLGGWGKRRGNIMLPLTPRHLLFVQIGKDSGRKLEMSREQTLLLRRLLVERADRWVFATEPMEWVSELRPRRVDARAFAAENEARDRWHQDQSRAEVSE